MSSTGFWCVMPCALTEIYVHFEGPCCLCHLGSWVRLQEHTVGIYSEILLMWTHLINWCISSVPCYILLPWICNTYCFPLQQWLHKRALSWRYRTLLVVLWYDMIYLLTAVGLTTGGSSTIHIYTQTIHRTIQ